jgi:hypothetical protein
MAKATVGEWTDTRVEKLCKCYVSFDTTSDKLAAEATLKRKFATAFNGQARTKFSGEALVKKLIELRKAKKLPRIRKVS